MNEIHLANPLMSQVIEKQNKISRFVESFAKEFQEVKAVLSEHEEILNRRVYLSPAEKKNVKKCVKAKVKEIAVQNGWPYKEASRILFAAVWNSIESAYNVSTYDELPSKYVDDILRMINNWELPESVKKRVEGSLKKNSKEVDENGND